MNPQTTIQAENIEKIDEGAWHIYGTVGNGTVRAGMTVVMPDGQPRNIIMVMGETGPTDEVAMGQPIVAVVDVRGVEDDYFQPFLDQNPNQYLAVS